MTVSLRQAKDRLLPVGVSINKTSFDEYRVCLYGSPEAHAYYTDEFDRCPFKTGLALARELSAK